jgi:hypothetical protein
MQKLDKNTVAQETSRGIRLCVPLWGVVWLIALLFCCGISIPAFYPL